MNARLLRETDRFPDDPLRGARLLVAEDEVLIALELHAILADAGAEVVGPALSIPAALTLAATETLSGAILDLTLLRSTIVPVAQVLAQRGVPFVFYTGQDDVRPVVAEWPESRIILKPALPRVVVRAIAAALHHHPAHT